MTIRALAIATAALLVPFVAACSDDDDGQPSRSEVSKSLQDNATLPKEQADCIAKAIDTELPDKVLRAIADDNEDNISNGEKTRATEAIDKAATSCVGEVELPDGVTVPE